MQIDEDEVMAALDLADRCGATDVDLGFLHDDKPAHLAGWWASVSFRGAKVMVENQAGPAEAAAALARRLLDGAQCRCGKAVCLSGDHDDLCCRWRRVGPKWEPGCDAPPLNVEGQRGDTAAMQRALDGVTGNRAARRRAAKGKR
jgi:hypothetical protein